MESIDYLQWLAQTFLTVRIRDHFLDTFKHPQEPSPPFVSSGRTVSLCFARAELSSSLLPSIRVEKGKRTTAPMYCQKHTKRSHDRIAVKMLTGSDRGGRSIDPMGVRAGRDEPEPTRTSLSSSAAQTTRADAMEQQDEQSEAKKGTLYAR